jgi:hypothetical protein
MDCVSENTHKIEMASKISNTNDNSLGDFADAIRHEQENIKKEFFSGSIPEVFIPNWDNKPKARTPLLSLNNIGVLTHQNLTAIIAQPGVGKSSILEAIMANHLNSIVDSLGFSVPLDVKGILYLDFERTETDVHKAFEKTMMRAKIPHGTVVCDKVNFAALRDISTVSQRKILIEGLLEKLPGQLLLIDGAGGLVNDMNNTEEASQCITWLRSIAKKYESSILVTLHPNPDTYRPRGHIGSEICREAECVMLAKRVSRGGPVYITTAFEYGKNRNFPDAEGAYIWSESHDMFISFDLPNSLKTEKKAGRKNLPQPNDFTLDEHKKVLNLVFEDNEFLNAGAFKEVFKDVWSKQIGVIIGTNKAEEFRKYYLYKGWLIKTKGGTNNETIHQLNPEF